MAWLRSRRQHRDQHPRGAHRGFILPRLGIFPVSTAANFVAATLGAVILLVLRGVVRRR